MQQEEPNNKNRKKDEKKKKEEKKTSNEFVRKIAEEKYKYGFTTDVHTDIIERGLNEEVVRLISEKKGEPEWLLEFRLKAYRHWLTLEMPTWAHLRIPEIDYQAISYYADPTKKKEGPKSMDEVDPELVKTFNKLGIPLEEQMALSGMAVDAVMDSVSVKTWQRNLPYDSLFPFRKTGKDSDGNRQPYHHRRCSWNAGNRCRRNGRCYSNGRSSYETKNAGGRACRTERQLKSTVLS